MAFKVNTNSQSGGDNSTPDVDYKALDKYVVKTCRLLNPETLTGYVSGIVDLGVQKQEDAAVPFDGTKEEEEAIKAEKPDTYFGTVRQWNAQQRKMTDTYCKRWPSKPLQCVAIAVDFPEIKLNKGQFFGDEEAKELPLRIWLGGKFWNKYAGEKGLMMMGQMQSLRWTKENDKWTLNPKNILRRLQVESGMISPDAPFDANRMSEIIGKNFLWKVRIFINDKGYYTEKCSLGGPLGRGQKELPVESETLDVGFEDFVLDDMVRKMIPSHVKNQMRMAENYTTSPISAVLDGHQKNANDTPAASEDIEEDVPF